jgi:hypothetical protein
MPRSPGAHPGDANDPQTALGGSRISQRNVTLNPISLVAISCYDGLNCKLLR